MRFLLIFALVVVALTHVEGSPKGKGDKTCDILCPAVYDPVCAQDHAVKGSRPRTFGNECVMKSHNCENGAYMEVLYKGECKGSGGVRIS